MHPIQKDAPPWSALSPSVVRSARPVLEAAAGQPVLDLLTGPLRPATVVGAYPAAVLVAVDPTGDAADDGPGGIVSLITADATGVPHGLRVPVPSRDRPFAGAHPGDPAFVGAGGVRLGSVEVRVVRTVRTQVPRISCAPQAVGQIAAAAALAVRGVPAAAVDALRIAQHDQDPAATRRAVRALVGLGAGSTPGGDDVLAGTLAGLHATGRDVLVQQVWVAARDGLSARTTMVSADLLRLAAAGHACAEAIAVLRAAARPAGRSGTHDELGLAEALRRLLAVGHTSGADLATGLAIGLSAPAFGARHQPRLSIRPIRPLPSGRR
jgi:hypothetical protein